MNWSRRSAAQAGAMVLVGAVGGAVVAATYGASASSTAGTSGAASYAAGPGGVGSGSAAAPPFAAGPRHRGLPLSGTVSSVGSDSVTITVNGAAKTYAVTGNSDIDKNGEAKLSDLVKGDAVRFALLPDGKTIAVLHAGDEAKDRPAGAPPGAPRFGGGAGHRGLPQSGTVASVGTGSVTITVNGAAKTYAVTGGSDIDKNGEAKLSDLVKGDAVRFALLPDGKTIAVLHAGDEAKDRPAGAPAGGGRWGAPGGAGGYGGPPPSSAPSPS